MRLKFPKQPENSPYKCLQASKFNYERKNVWIKTSGKLIKKKFSKYDKILLIDFCISWVFKSNKKISKN